MCRKSRHVAVNQFTIIWLFFALILLTAATGNAFLSLSTGITSLHRTFDIRMFLYALSEIIKVNEKITYIENQLNVSKVFPKKLQAKLLSGNLSAS